MAASAALGSEAASAESAATSEQAQPATPERYRPAPSQLVREGAFLRDRRGRLVTAEGMWFYVFDRDETGRAEPPMVMQPCLRLREMRRLVETRPFTLTFQTTGSVYVYQGRNYFLPTFFSVISEQPIAPSPATDPKSGETPPSTPSVDPSVSELLASMKSNSPPPAMVSVPADTAATSEAAAPGTGEESVGLLREGLLLTSRRGRVKRMSDGGLVFVSDNGPDRPSRADPPLELLPCMNLESIEKLVQRYGDRLELTMSGRVFVHETKNYLLPTLFQIQGAADGNLMPAR